VISRDQIEWEKTLNWPEVGPKLIAALEDIDWALCDDHIDAARDIIVRVFREIGRDKLDRVPVSQP